MNVPEYAWCVLIFLWAFLAGMGACAWTKVYLGH